MSNTDYAVDVTGLRKAFGKVEVLKGVDLRVKRGTLLALLGPNGAGKTTTVRILSTLLKPDGGSALIEGYDVAKQANKVRQSIGLTGQYAAVDEYLTGAENLHMMGKLYHLPKSVVVKRTKELLEEFDLIEASSRPVKTYSGGMRRRLDLAMSLIASPPVIFLDEPTTGLDPRSRLQLWETIKQLTIQGATILLTTQYMDEADHLADRIAVIDEGKVIAEGTADELKAKVGAERIELTLGKKASMVAAQKAIDGKEVRVDEQRHTISVTTKAGVRDLKDILSRLEAANIDVEGLSLHRPTLDDVFLTLTGHAATTDTEDTPASKQKKEAK